ncbi:L-type lectin-domain containing protein, partial [Flavobacterium hauense]
MKKIFHMINARPHILLLGFCLLFSFAGFAQLTPTFIGSATSTSPNCYTITTNTQSNSGAAWYNNPIDLSQDFDIVYSAFFGANAGGADGMAFVLKSTPNAVIGTVGGGLGYQNILGASLAVEFDTYTNGTPTNDPSYDHIALHKNGNIYHSGSDNLIGPVQASSTSTNIKDNQQHEVKITWRANTHILKVYFDCVERISYDNQIIISIFGGQPTVYFGFTGSTGALSNQQSVCFKYLSFLPSSFQDQIVCEGGSVNNVDGTIQGAASYQWSPATGVSNPTIANPVFTPTVTTTYVLTVTDSCGQTIVRDFTATIADIGAADPIDLVACGDPTQTHEFDLHENDAVIKAPLADPDDYEVEYYASMQEINDGDPMIWYPSGTGYPGTNGQVIYAKIVGFSNPCYIVRPFVLRISDCEVEMEPYTVHVCEPAPYDGFEIFDLTSYTDEMTVANPVPASYVYAFYHSQANAEAENNPITNPTTYSGTTETIWVRADDTSVTGFDSYGIEQLSLIVTSQPDIAAVNDVSACGSYTLPALTMGNYYSQPGGAGAQLNPAVPLTSSQTVYIYATQGTAPNTCTDEESFDVTIYTTPIVPELSDVQACDTYELAPLTVGGYYTAAGGTGTQLFPGDFITTTQTIYIYAVTGDATTICSDESDFVVT